MAVLMNCGVLRCDVLAPARLVAVMIPALHSCVLYPLDYSVMQPPQLHAVRPHNSHSVEACLVNFIRRALAWYKPVL